MNAGPGRVRQWIDVELQCITGFAPRGTRLICRPVRHLHGDFVVFRMDFFFHRRILPPQPVIDQAGLYSSASWRLQEMTAVKAQVHRDKGRLVLLVARFVH
jgi:hypothetical protein